jgi:hypothetical protein
MFPLFGNLLTIYKFHSQLATYDDFDDDVVDVKGPAGLSNVLVSCKVSQFINANMKKLKVLKLRFYRQIPFAIHLLPSFGSYLQELSFKFGVEFQYSYSHLYP